MRPGIVIGVITIALAIVGGLLDFSVRAGALENRVSQLERMSEKMDHALDSLARIEARMDDQDRRTKK